MLKFKETKLSDCMLLSCHVRVSEWIHTLWFALMSRKSLLEAGSISEIYVTVTQFEPTTT